jgi:hypothetical protein
MKTWKPTAAGVLSILVGAFICQFQTGKAVHAHSLTWPLAIAVAVTDAIGVLAILGGISALRRKVWGLALAGAICAVFPPHFYGRLIWTPVLGVVAVVLVVLSKSEFSSSLSGRPKAAHPQADDSGPGSASSHVQ